MSPWRPGSEADLLDLAQRLADARRGKLAYRAAREAITLRRRVDDALMHYEIGCEPDGLGLPVDWRYVARRMASALGAEVMAVDDGPDGPPERCPNAGCGSGAVLDDDGSCPCCGWQWWPGALLEVDAGPEADES